DECDNCPTKNNEDQLDKDDDGFGDRCDLCLNTPSAENVDVDGDGLGDACDNCPYDLNKDQADADLDGRGDVCDRTAIRGGGELKPVQQGCDTSGGGALGIAGALLLLGITRRRGARAAGPGSE
ncbi:MAG: thrombospondin type 3 repeat-containing protein, partial [Myxococcales bacterium]|nr:thrombospondin type 3 repeat-containing protein [Myxococcales bacterium]